jgi:hypothetical protein
MLTISYWILLLLLLIGLFAPPTWTYWPRAYAVIILILFIIIGLKSLKPTL